MSNRIADSLFHTGCNEELIRALLEFHVRFVVIGGLAISWHCPSRSADDMDILIEPTIENSGRVANALTRVGLNGFGPDSFANHGKQARLDRYHYADLLTPSGNISFSDVDADAVDAKLFNIPVRVASVVTLIRMKEAAINACQSEASKHSRDIELLNACSQEWPLQRNNLRSMKILG